MRVDPYELPAAANDIAEEPLKTFVCIKCRDEVEYAEFFKHDDPTFDYGFYVLAESAYAVGVEIIKGFDLCEWCVPNMYHAKEKKDD
jgi:hypothetical protein